MRLNFFKNTILLMLLVCFSCGSQEKNKGSETFDDGSGPHFAEASDGKKAVDVIVGAERFSEYKEVLTGKNIGIVANQTSMVGDVHLVDFLLQKGLSVKKVFAPEHGFRGKADAGEKIVDGIDSKTGIPIVSLYGDNKKPKMERLAATKELEQDIETGVSEINIMVFDLQDVGARFYTYISTLHYVMEACAEANIPLVILDRPNPNGHYIDGPILEKEHFSFVGMHPIPVVHGMTIGEYAQMINGEGWLKNKVKCAVTVIKMKGYTHQTEYSLPVKPSPNLPNDTAINLYPSLCFFEGTFVSAGRGTEMQFQIFGAPSLPSEKYTFSFTPQANEGAKYPKFKGEKCFGKDLRSTPKLDKINLDWLIEAYISNGKKKDFFNEFFTKLAGTKQLQKQIEQGLTSEEIRKTWQEGLARYDAMRQEYLLYN
jgi:uncharacterized protein YbbC (DUF1343 family)